MTGPDFDHYVGARMWISSDDSECRVKEPREWFGRENSGIWRFGVELSSTDHLSIKGDVPGAFRTCSDTKQCKILQISVISLKSSFLIEDHV